MNSIPKGVNIGIFDIRALRAQTRDGTTTRFKLVFSTIE